jgi:Skp family chaperone for outer membrane proteins
MRFIFKIVWFITFLPIIAFANEEIKLDSAEDLSKFDARVAVVDVESILEHSQAIVHIKKSINIISEQIQTELSSKEIQLKDEEAELIKQRGALSKDKFDDLVAAFNKRVSATQQEMQHKKTALEQAHANAIAEVHKNTIDVISDLSKKYGFNIVFPSSQVLFVNNSLNITHEVISDLNESLKTVEVKYQPGGAKKE